MRISEFDQETVTFGISDDDSETVANHPALHRIRNPLYTADFRGIGSNIDFFEPASQSQCRFR